MNLGEIQRDKIGLFLKGSSKKILQLYPKFGQFDKWFLMVKIAFENGTYTGYNLGKHNPIENIFTKELFKDEFVGLTRD